MEEKRRKVESADERRERFYRLRQDGKTLEEIAGAEDPPISRQRVQQILGVTGHMASGARIREVLRFPPEVTDYEIAEQLGLSTAYIQKIRRAGPFRALKKGSGQGIGSQGIFLVSNRLKERGIEHSITGLRGACSILAFTKNRPFRIRVLTRSKEYKPPSGQGNPYYSFFERNRDEEIDLVVAVALDIETCYVLPAEQITPGVGFRIVPKKYGVKNKYWKREENWSLFYL